MSTQYGVVLSVDTRPAGSTTTVPAAAGSTTLFVGDVFNFNADGGSLRIGESVLPYVSATPGLEDTDDATIELASELPGSVADETLILVEPYGEQRVALLDLDDEGDALEVVVPHALSAVLTDGIRDPDDRETVSLEETSPGAWVMVDVIGRRAELTAAVTDPLASDGLPPAESPTPTVIGGIGALFARWAAVENHDLVSYDVHVSTVDDFDPVAPEDIGPGDPTVSDDFNDLAGWNSVQGWSQVLPEPVEVPTVADGKAVIPGGYRLDRKTTSNLINSTATFQLDASGMLETLDSETRTKTGNDATALIFRVVQGLNQLLVRFLVDDGSIMAWNSADGGVSSGSNFQYSSWTPELTHVRFRHLDGRILLQTSTNGLDWVEAATWDDTVIDLSAVQLAVGAKNFDTDGDLVQAPYVTVDYFEVAPNTNATSTLAATTTATSLTMRQLPGGAALAYDTTYYVKLVARDVDGRAAPSATGSGRMVRVNSPDIAAEYVYAGALLADQITGGSIQSDVLLSGSIRTAAAGARVEMTAFGLVIYQPDGTPTTQLGSDGQSTFKGQVQASTLTVTGGMAIRGGLNELSKAGILKLSAATQNSPNAPTVVCDYPRVPLTSATGDHYAGYAFRSLQKVGSEYWVAMTAPNGTDWALRKFNASGAYQSYIPRNDLGLGQFATVPGAEWGLAIRDGEPTLIANRITYSTPQFNDSMSSLTNWDVTGPVTTSGGKAVLTQTGQGTTSMRSKVFYNLRSRALFSSVTVPVLTSTQTFTVMLINSTSVRIEVEFAYVSTTTLKATLRTVNSSTVKTSQIATGLAQGGNFGLYIDVHGSYTRAWINGQGSSSNKIIHGMTAAQLQSMKIDYAVADTTDISSGNLISNYSFEAGIGGWEPSGGPFGALSWTDTQAHTGSHSAAFRRVDVEGASIDNAGVELKASSKKAVTPGQRVEVSYWIKAGASASTVGATADIMVDFYDSLGNYIGDEFFSPTEGETLTTGWTKKTATFTVGTTARYATFTALVYDAPSTSAIYYLDDVYIGPAPTGTITARVDTAVVDWIDGDIDLGPRKNTSQPPAVMVTDTGTYGVGEYDATANKISVRWFDPEAPDVASSAAELVVTPPDGFVGPIASVNRGVFDFGAYRTIVKELGSRDYLSYNGLDGTATLVTSNQFPADAGGSVGATWSASDAGFIALGSNGYLYYHTGPTSGLTGPTGPWSAAFTWYDGDATGGTHETQPSPRAVFTMQKRARITVTSPDIPDNGGTDDPDRIRVYVAQTASGTLYLQGTTAAGVQSFQTSVVAFTGTQPPTSSNFPGEAPASIVNDAGTLAISGDGTVRAANLISPALDARFNALEVSVTDFGAVAGGVAGQDNTAAFQAALDYLDARGGGVLRVPANPQSYRVASATTGAVPIYLRSNILIHGYGATLAKAHSNTFRALFTNTDTGGLGYGSTNRNIVVRGLRFKGDFAGGVTICPFALHHVKGLTVEECIFEECQGRTGHIFDLCGCEAIRVRRNQFLGYDTHGTGDAIAESVQIGASNRGGLTSGTPPTGFDGLYTRDVTVEDNKFLPFTASDSTVYPCGNPLGGHNVTENLYYEQIKFLRNYVQDPIQSISDDDSDDGRAYYFGVVHIPTVHGLEIIGNEFVNTTGTANRVISLCAKKSGTLASSDPATTPSTVGPWASPVVSKDVLIQGNTFRGWTVPSGSTAQEVILIFGVSSSDGSGDQQSIRITGNVFQSCYTAGSTSAELIRVRNARGITIADNHGTDVTSIVLLDTVHRASVHDNVFDTVAKYIVRAFNACDDISVDRNIVRGFGLPIRFDATTRGSISGNKLSKPTSTGTDANGILAVVGSGVSIIGNTVHNDTGTTQTRGIAIGSGLTTSTVGLNTITGYTTAVSGTPGTGTLLVSNTG